MKNIIKSFRLFVRQDEKSLQVAKDIRELNSKRPNPLVESEDADLIIAIGGDGTCIDAIRETKFSKDKIYTGVHTGTLGFMQDLSPSDIFSLIQYINFEQDINVRKVPVSSVEVFLKNGNILQYNALNDVIVGGEDFSRIYLDEEFNGEMLQNISGSGIIIASPEGDTAVSLNSGGSIDFSGSKHLTCSHIIPTQNAVGGKILTNPIICTNVSLTVRPAKNIIILIDGRRKHEVQSELIERINVSIDNDIYINKLELVSYSKVRRVREKILGY